MEKIKDLDLLDVIINNVNKAKVDSPINISSSYAAGAGGTGVVDNDEEELDFTLHPQHKLYPV